MSYYSPVLETSCSNASPPHRSPPSRLSNSEGTLYQPVRGRCVWAVSAAPARVQLRELARELSLAQQAVDAVVGFAHPYTELATRASAATGDVQAGVGKAEN